MTTLFLVRHGETLDNKRQILQGQMAGELDDEGRRQARALRDKMAAEAIDDFVSSDLWRAVETCRIIAEPHGKEVFETPLLRERDWGSFTGKFIPDIRDATWPDDIETLDALKARAGRFLDLIGQRYKGHVVLAVGHGIINKAIQSVFYAKPMNQVERMGNADVRVLRW